MEKYTFGLFKLVGGIAKGHLTKEEAKEAGRLEKNDGYSDNRAEFFWLMAGKKQLLQQKL